MKKILLATALLAATVASASAADIAARPYTKAPPPAPVYNWTGLYVGAHIGAAFNDDSHSLPTVPTFFATNSKSAFVGGGQIGADWQFDPSFLIGIEGQISGGSSQGRTFTDAAGDAIQDRTSWLGSVTGRAGYVNGALLLYVKGGVGFRDNGGVSAFAAPGIATPFTNSRATSGGTGGIGAEYMFAPGWSVKSEYQYYSFGKTTVTVPAVAVLAGGVGYRDDIHTFKVGVNYHFNWGGPVVAKF